MSETNTTKQRPLTAKQSRFVDEYLVDLNATQAAIRAGYSPVSAQWVGPQMLTKTHVAEAVQARRAAREQATGITQARVLEELARLAFFDVRRLVDSGGVPINAASIDEDTARAINGLDVVRIGNADVGEGEVLKFKLADKGRALELLMRHLGMLEKDNHQRNPVGGFDAAKFFTDLFRRPGGEAGAG